MDDGQSNASAPEQLLLVVHTGGAPIRPGTDPKQHTVVLDDGIHTDQLAAVSDSLQCKEIEPIVLTFRKAIDNIQHVMALPLSIIAYFVIPVQLPGMYVEALNALHLSGRTHFTPDEMAAVQQKMEELRQAEMLRLVADDQLIHEANTMLSDMMQVETVHQGVGAILSSGIVAAWTALECLAHDLWQHSL